MQAKRIFKPQINMPQPNTKTETLSRQVENLREVLRRVPGNKSSTVDSLISQKLKAAK